jgi:hypothetical protein
MNGNQSSDGHVHILRYLQSQALLAWGFFPTGDIHNDGLQGERVKLKKSGYEQKVGHVKRGK